MPICYNQREEGFTRRVDFDGGRTVVLVGNIIAES